MSTFHSDEDSNASEEYQSACRFLLQSRVLRTIHIDGHTHSESRAHISRKLTEILNQIQRFPCLHHELRASIQVRVS